MALVKTYVLWPDPSFTANKLSYIRQGFILTCLFRNITKCLYPFKTVCLYLFVNNEYMREKSNKSKSKRPFGPNVMIPIMISVN